MFYGLARMRVPTNLSSLLEAAPDSRQRALNAAVGRCVIPGRFADRAEELDAKIRRSVVDNVGRQGNLPLGEVLAETLPDAALRERFLATYSKHEGSPEDFWRKVSRNPALRPSVPELQASLQIAAMSGGHVPLVKDLLAARRAGTFSDVRELAQYDTAEWKRKIKALPPGQRVPDAIPASGDAAVDLYAETIFRIVEDTMPTEVLAYRSSADGSLSPDEQRFWTNVTKTFTDARPRFALGGVDLAAYVDKNKDLLNGVGKTDVLLDGLRTTQRLFALTTRHDEVGLLRAAGLDSSTAITRVGRGVFLARYQGALGAERSELIFNKAEHIAATAMAVLADVSPRFNSVPLAALDAPAVKQVPSLANLVGTLDLCACTECRSVGGPASYYAETLAYLGDRELQPAPATGEATALDVLLGRRPDLGEIELTCENTNTVLPYIDLVNEILESAITPFAPFALAGARAGELDARTITPALRTAFAAHEETLTDDHVAYVVQPNERWFVTDHSVLYGIEEELADEPHRHVRHVSDRCPG